MFFASPKKKLRRITASLTVLSVLCATMFAGAAFASPVVIPDPTKIQIGVIPMVSGAVHQGETVTFAAGLSNIPVADEAGISSLNFNINFDSTVFDLEGYTLDGELLQPSNYILSPALISEGFSVEDVTITEDAGMGSLNFIILGNETSPLITTETSTFITFKLNVKADAPIGASEVSISVPEGLGWISDSDYNEVPANKIQSISGNVDVAALPVLDGVTANADALSLMMMSGSTQVHLQGHKTDNSSVDYTNLATWTSNNPVVAAVSPTGLVKAGPLPGVVTITGTYGGFSSNVQISVVPVVIPPPPTPIFLNLQGSDTSVALEGVEDSKAITVSEIYSMGAPVDVTYSGTWVSQDVNIATVEDGLIMAQGEGSTTVTFTNGHGSLIIPVTVGVASSEPEFVSIRFANSTNQSFEIGVPWSLELLGKYLDNAEEDLDPSTLTYTIDDPNIATVSEDGVLEGVSAGMTMLTATLNGVGSVSTYIMVVSDAENLPAPAGFGIVPALDGIEVGSTIPFKMMISFVTPVDGLDGYDFGPYTSWESSDDSLATVDENGNVTALSEGTVTITAHVALLGDFNLELDLVPGTISVEPKLTALSADSENFGLSIGAEHQFVLTGTYDDESTADVTSQATWSSDDEDVVTVSESGKVTAIGAGSTQIHATIGGLTHDIAVTVTGLTVSSFTIEPSSVSITTGSTKQLKVNAVLSDASAADLAADADYTSSNTAVATVSDAGLVTGVAAGTTVITVELGEITHNITVTVSATSGGSESGTGGTGTVVLPPVESLPDLTLKNKYNNQALEELRNKGAENPTTSPYTDVPLSSSAAVPIGRATNMGIITGYGDGSFRPNAIITRAEFATIVSRTFGLVNTGAEFSDTAGHWASQQIEALASAGVLTGYTDGTFRPNQEITRAEIVTILSRLMDYKAPTTSTFNDVEGNWASQQIEAFASAGIVTGKSESEFAPNDSATRAESITILIRLLDKITQ
ncbi:Ig-like domain-containing protein [Paenibacillus sp. YAF4_2]|uniref:Ig-like domain-containing protein n=1 Tax=Paenibacillus sp. YAF4_2 TaxID=3233085 RepID=UPI003F9A2F4D